MHSQGRMRHKHCRDFALIGEIDWSAKVSREVLEACRGLDPRPIAVRDFTKYTISTLPVKARDAVSAALAAEAVALPMSVAGHIRKSGSALP